MLQARRGSTHGYDVVDPARLNPELGTEAELDGLHAELAARGMGIVLDIVPNHMAASGENAAWDDVLANGPASAFAALVRHRLARDRARAARHGFCCRSSATGCPTCSAGARSRSSTARACPAFATSSTIFRSILPPCTDSSARAEPALPSRSGPGASRLSGSGGDRRRAAPAAATDQPRGAAALAARRDAAPKIARPPARPGGARSARSAAALAEAAAAFTAGADGRAAAAPAARGPGIPAGALAPCRAGDQLPPLLRRERSGGTAHGGSGGLRPDPRAGARLAAARLVDGFRIDHPDGLLDPLGYFQRLAAAAAEGESSPPVYVEKILSHGRAAPLRLAGRGDHRLRFPEPGRGAVHRSGGVRGRRGRLPPGDPAAAGVPRHRAAGEAAGAGDRALGRRAPSGGPAAQARGPRPDAAGGPETGADPRDRRDDRRAAGVSHVHRRPARRRRDRTTGGCWKPRSPKPGRGDAALAAALDLLESVLLARETRPRGPDARAVPAPLRRALPADQRTRDGEGHRGHRLLRLRAAALAERGRRRARGAPGSGRRRFPRRQCRPRRPVAGGAAGGDDARHQADRRRSLAARRAERDPGRMGRTGVQLWRKLNLPHKRTVRGRRVPDPGDGATTSFRRWLGIWPLSPLGVGDLGVLRERLGGYMVKAVREAKLRTTWTDPDESFEAALRADVEALLAPDRSPRFLRRHGAVRRGDRTGRAVERPRRTVLHLASPGVPDLYQGDELWNFALVDPDNRRPVDFDIRRRLLEEVGAGHRRRRRRRARYPRGSGGRAGGRAAQAARDPAALAARTERPAAFRSRAYLAARCARPIRRAGRGIRPRGRASSDWSAAVPRLLGRPLASGGAPTDPALWDGHGVAAAERLALTLDLCPQRPDASEPTPDSGCGQPISSASSRSRCCWPIRLLSDGASMRLQPVPPGATLSLGDDDARPRRRRGPSRSGACGRSWRRSPTGWTRCSGRCTPREPRAARRAAGPRRVGQGRNAAEGVRAARPARRDRHQLQGADRAGATARLPLAGPSRGAAPRDDRDLQPLPLRGRAGGAGARARPGVGLAAALRADQSLRADPDRERHRDPQVPAAHLAARSSGERLRRGWRIRRSTGSSTRGTCRSGSCGTGTPRRTRRCWRGPARRVAPWYVVPADEKRVRDVLVARTVTDTLERMSPRYPGPPARARGPAEGAGR